MGEESIISIRGLKNQFGKQVVHEGLDLDVRRGEILGVIGGSGSGKSVLLRTIIGLQRPAAGRVEVLGTDVVRASRRQMNELRRRWGILFQDGALYSSLTVSQNVQTPLREFHDISHGLRCDLACLKISMVGLQPEAANKYPSELSGGMRKRAGLARALILDPDLVFLDEPTAGLDPVGAAAFDGLIRELQEVLGLTVFLVTHDLDTLAAICDRIAVLAENRIYAIGTLEEMMALDHPWIHEYFHGPRARAALDDHGTSQGAEHGD
jgi:phospholipid/cholesterol/gamma-HCH transport system ATP-binding protein